MGEADEHKTAGEGLILTFPTTPTSSHLWSTFDQTFMSSDVYCYCSQHTFIAM